MADREYYWRAFEGKSDRFIAEDIGRQLGNVEEKLLDLSERATDEHESYPESYTAADEVLRLLGPAVKAVRAAIEDALAGVRERAARQAEDMRFAEGEQSCPNKCKLIDEAATTSALAAKIRGG